jgi:alkaline phosphatase D
MSGLREPGLGPIVGHTTDKTCRVWIRAQDPTDSGSRLSAERRTVGVISVIKKNGKTIPNAPTYYFRLHREYDRTGSFSVGEEISLGEKGKVFRLEANTQYTVRVATLALDDPFVNEAIISDEDIVARLPAPSIWRDELLTLEADKCEATFRTFADPSADSENLSFIVGSCRYPGLLWKVKHSDRIFAPLQKETQHANGGVQPSFVLMVGDQIYADMLGRRIPIGLADTFEEFQERYITAFGSPNMRKLLRTVPTYMILDDHEIEDNWTQDRINTSDKRRLFNIAMGAYMSYQWSHGPRSFRNRLYYHFDCGRYPFFALDTRTQRYINDEEDSLDDNHLLGRPSLSPNEPNQVDRLLSWLKTQQDERGDVPKFIVCPTVFVPNPMNARECASVRAKERCDAWPGFPNTRRALLQCIVDNAIQNVIFVSGDIHCSNVAEMHFKEVNVKLPIKAFSITSSAFYWPFPFADGDAADYVHDSTKAFQKDTFTVDQSRQLTMDYKAWNFTQVDNYCRVDIDRDKAELKIRAFDYKGNLIVEDSLLSKKRRMVSTLKLSPW